MERVTWDEATNDLRLHNQQELFEKLQQEGIISSFTIRKNPGTSMKTAILTKTQ